MTNQALAALALNEDDMNRLRSIFRGSHYADVVYDGQGVPYRAEIMIADKTNIKEARKGALEIDDEFIIMSADEGETNVYVYPNDLFGAR